MEAPLYRYDDVYDAASGLVSGINARLHRRGLQLEPTAAYNLRHTLEGVLHLMEVQVLPECLAVEEALAREVA